MEKMTKEYLEEKLKEQMEAFKLDACDYILNYSEDEEVQEIAEKYNDQDTNIEEMTEEETLICLDDFQNWDDNAEDGTRAFYELGKVNMLKQLISEYR